MAHPVPGYVPLPVDRVEVVVLAQAGNIGLGPGMIVAGLVRAPTEVAGLARFPGSVVEPVHGLIGGACVLDVQEVFV